MVTVTRHAHKIVCCIIQTHVMKSYSHYRGYISIQTRLHEPQFPHIHSTWHLISLRKRLKCNGFGLLRSGRHDQESSLRMFLTESSCHSALGNRTHSEDALLAPEESSIAHIQKAKCSGDTRSLFNLGWGEKGTNKIFFRSSIISLNTMIKTRNFLVTYLYLKTTDNMKGWPEVHDMLILMKNDVTHTESSQQSPCPRTKTTNSLNREFTYSLPKDSI